ncbi:MAG: glycoside hydrolase family 2 protein, partial [Lachnospiraceae bacterium]|nr:glycoside hydrolase family 2 protein [Lachnospiraceae bacterium]
MTNQKIVLNGNWQLQDESGECLCDCTVPGSVLSAMLDAHLIEDPYYRMNEYPTRELLKKDYSFTHSFFVERQENLYYELVCDGIDTVADIYLNGEKIESVDNMH